MDSCRTSLQGLRSRGVGKGGTFPPPQYFENYKELVRKSILCPPPPPPPNLKRLLRGACATVLLVLAALGLRYLREIVTFGRSLLDLYLREIVTFGGLFFGVVTFGGSWEDLRALTILFPASRGLSGGEKMRERRDSLLSLISRRLRDLLW